MKPPIFKKDELFSEASTSSQIAFVIFRKILDQAAALDAVFKTLVLKVNSHQLSEPIM